jgi:hypothetical protein
MASSPTGSNCWVPGIAHNRCIDDDLLARLYPEDAALMFHLGRGQNDMFAAPRSAKKDAGQRKECGCIVSKDIGAYNRLTVDFGRGPGIDYPAGFKVDRPVGMPISSESNQPEPAR